MAGFKRKKLSRYEKREEGIRIREQRLHGEGRFVFRNKGNQNLILPKPTKNGIKTLNPNQEFEGDSYFLSLVRAGELILVKTIQSQNEAREENNMKTEQTLILDQPPTITESGTVINVTNGKPLKKLNEIKNDALNKEPADVLIIEDPMEGLTIITD